MSLSQRTALVVPAILLLVALVYWPVYHGDFVWDDITDFIQNPGWVVAGDGWKHYIFRDFHGWTHYFRPLVVALFTVQVRLFDVQPGPMHMVSLAAHLGSTTLVGLLALRTAKAAGKNGEIIPYLLAGCMLLYGLHPAAIEPVAWIASQFDLFATLFMLLGLYCSISIQGAWRRPLAVASCFLLAALSKESAVSFPLMLVVFDWLIQSRLHPGPISPPSITRFIQHNLRTYLAVFCAGLIYLGMRHWALADNNMSLGNSDSLLTRLQLAAHSYFAYWRAAFIPAYEMNPIHAVDMQRFASASLSAILLGIAALTLVTTASIFWLRRAAAWAGIILMMSAALLPVIQLLPTGMDNNLYHERYLITGLAACCALLPLLSPRLPLRRPVLQAGAVLMLLAWCLSSAITIRATLPLWGNSVALWRWALDDNPNDIMAQSNMLASYLYAGMQDEASTLMEAIKASDSQCSDCWLNIAQRHIDENQLDTAEAILIKIKDWPGTFGNRQRTATYLYFVGNLLMAQKHYADAEDTYREAVKLLPSSPQMYLDLIRCLAVQGRTSEARALLVPMLDIAPSQNHEQLRAKAEQLITKSQETDLKN